MMSFEELSKRDAAFGDRIAQRERQLIALCLVPAALLVAALLASNSLQPLLLRLFLISIGLLAIFTVLTSRRYFRDVTVRCSHCDQSVNGLLGTAEEDVEYGEPMPKVLYCPRCQAEIATAT